MPELISAKLWTQRLSVKNTTGGCHYWLPSKLPPSVRQHHCYLASTKLYFLWDIIIIIIVWLAPIQCTALLGANKNSKLFSI